MKNINKYIIILLSVFLLNGCVLDQVLKAGESGSNSYKTVKNANSLGDVAKGIVTLTKAQETKAKTSDTFVKAGVNLIANQPIEKQPALIRQSIEAKVALAKNTYFKGFTLSSVVWLFLITALMVLKYVFDRLKPKKRKTEYD